jgi:hypothetical protein
MFFWRIARLKEELVLQPLAARAELPYLIAYVLLATAGLYIPYAGGDVPRTVDGIVMSAIAVVGTIYVYRQNGGANGTFFLQRYFAIGWVVTVRFAALLTVMFAGYAIILAAFGRDVPDRSPWYETLVQWLWHAALFYRIGYHTEDVARRANAV